MKIAVLCFYAAGSICFLAGSIISILAEVGK